MLKPGGFVTDDLEVFARGRQHAVMDSLCMTQDQAQGRAEFMSDIGRHLLARIDRARELAAHCVECLGQLTQFIVRSNRHLLRKITLRDSMRGLCQLPDWTCKCTGEKNTQQ